ncbi:RNA-directed DNA polymerase, eukaryota [Tanacetum coccineum]
MYSLIAGLVSNTQSAFVAGRQILDGPFILNEVLDWCKRKKKKALFFKVDFAKAYDSVRWDFLLDVLEAFGFGSTWCTWIRGISDFAKASLLVMEVPSDEVSYHRGLKQGDHAIAFFLFLLWKLCFIRLAKFWVWGYGSRVEDMASSLGCTIMENKFRYLGVMVGAGMTRHKAWDDVILKLQSRLSKWKAKTLSIGGVLKVMESIRSNFFKGASMLEKKISWIAWDKVLASKKKGGLGVSSYFALNRALLLKIDSHSVRKVSIWSSILKEVQVLKSSGFDFLSYCSKRIGDGQSTSFWKETWMGDIPLLVLSTSNDRWYFSLSSSGEFSVKDTRLAIDDLVLPSHSEPTSQASTKQNVRPADTTEWIEEKESLATKHSRPQKRRLKNHKVVEDTSEEEADNLLVYHPTH